MNKFFTQLKLNQINTLLKSLQLTRSSINNNVHINRSFHSSTCLLEQINIKMPSLSPTMTEGTIVKWLKQEGDKVSPGDSLFEVQTDKAVVTYDTEEEGVLGKILKTSDSGTINVGTLVGVLVQSADELKNIKIDSKVESSASKTTKKVDAQATPQPSTPAPPPPSQPQQQQQQEVASTGHDISNTRLVGPAVKALASQYHVDISKIKGTGPHGLIVKSDIKEYIRANNLQPRQQSQQQAVAAEATTTAQRPSQVAVDDIGPEYVDIELTNMRKVIAKRLLLSKTAIPHSYLNVTCVMDDLVKLRNEQFKITNVKVSLNDYLIKAVALALRMVPEMNQNIVNLSTNPDDDIKYQQVPTVDISIAVATDKGLITPIIKNADTLSIEQISKQMRVLAEKAKANKLLPHEFQGGSFSISNLGMFGIKEFSAVINPPQIGILAIGKSDLVLNPVNNKAQTQTIAKLSFDERAIQLDRSHKFLDYFKYFIENPQILVEQQQTIDSL